MCRATLIWGALIVLVVLALAAAAPWIAPYRYDEMQIMARAEATELRALVWHRRLWPRRPDPDADRRPVVVADGLGRDCVLPRRRGADRALHGLSTRGRVEEIVMRAMDVLMSFPPILLGLLVLAVTTPSLWKTVLAVGVVYVPAIVRLTRSVTLELAQEEFVLAAEARGDGSAYIAVARDPAQCVAADRRRGQPAYHVRHSAWRCAELPRAWVRSRRARTGA